VRVTQCQAPILRCPIMCAFLATILAACAIPQARIDQAVSATRTADRVAADAIAAGIAATLAAMPSPSPLPTLTAQSATLPQSSPTAIACAEDMTGLQFLSAGLLSGGRFLVTLEKNEPFLMPEYKLTVDLIECACSPLDDDANRIYCVGSPVPNLPSGGLRRLAEVKLLAATGDCSFDIPFDTIPLPPKPTPDRPSGSGSGSGYP
jgi:hypothetical protein